MSLKGGIKEAVFNDANGFVSRKIASPAQYITHDTSIPSKTDPFTFLLSRIIIKKRPMSIVTTASTIAE